MTDRRAERARRPSAAATVAGPRSRRSRRSSCSAGSRRLILTSPGWPVVRDSFFDSNSSRESFREILVAFWLDIRVFLVVEVVVLVARPGRRPDADVAPAPALFPVRAMSRPSTRDVFRGIPTILLVYLIGFGVPALAVATDGGDPAGWLPTEPVVLGGIALALSYGPTSPRSTAPGSTRCTAASATPRSRSG